MVKILTDKDLQAIMEEVSTPAYFFQKEKNKERDDFQHLYEDDGSVIIEFVTGIAKIEPDDNDLLGRKWNGGQKDKEGNPVLDKSTGRVRDAWDKFEAKVIIKGKELIYGFGGQRGALFREFINGMQREKITNEKLVGTKWRVICNDMRSYDWSVELLNGEKKETTNPQPQPVKEAPKEISKPDDEYKKVVNAILKIKEVNKGKEIGGLEEDELVAPISFFSDVDGKKIKGYFKQLEENGLIKKSNGKIYIQ